jgi:hypothetical protein
LLRTAAPSPQAPKQSRKAASFAIERFSDAKNDPLVFAANGSGYVR